MHALYPPITPYQTGMLAVGDGHEIYYERCGTPGATPAVFLHGGPGGEASAEVRSRVVVARRRALERGVSARALAHAGLEPHEGAHAHPVVGERPTRIPRAERDHHAGIVLHRSRRLGGILEARLLTRQRDPVPLGEPR